MAVVRFEKVVSTLPETLTPDTLYMVRVGAGFDFYVSDSTGAVAHALNSGGGGGAAETLGTITGQMLDLSSGNVFDYTPTENTTFVFSNPPASGEPFTFKLILNGAETADGYDLVNAAYDNVSFSVSGQESLPRGLFLKPDGTKMYVVGTGTDTLFQYSLSTPWDLSTASYDGISLALGGFPTDVFFKPDGTRLYIATPNPDGVNQYNLSNAWDLSSASYNSRLGVSSNPFQSELSSDGSKLFVLISDTDRVSQYSLSTPWEVATATYERDFSVGPQDGSPYAFTFRPDGLKFYMVGAGSTIYQYSVINPWDLNGASYESVSLVTSEGVNRDIVFSDDGTKLYGLSSTNDLYQYTTVASAPATFTYPASVKFPGGTPPAGPGAGEIDTIELLTVDGGTSYLARLTGDNYS